MRSPTKDEAQAFALIVHTGLPYEEAIHYFLTEDESLDPAFVLNMTERWKKAKEVNAELDRLRGGKKWQDMSLEERIRFAVDKHYAEMAYYLFSHNYVTMTGAAELNKAEKARETLEKKIAGTAGLGSPMEQFWADLKSGKVSLPKVSVLPTREKLQ